MSATGYLYREVLVASFIICHLVAATPTWPSGIQQYQPKQSQWSYSQASGAWQYNPTNIQGSAAVPEGLSTTKFQGQPNVVFKDEASGVKPLWNSPPTLPGSGGDDSETSMGLQMLKLLSEGSSDNVILSSWSSRGALALLQQGAQGAAKDELDKALGQNAIFSRHRFAGVLESLKTRRSNNALLMANNIFVGRDITLDPVFKSVASRFFRADIESVNFLNAPLAASKINSWANEMTRGRIPTLVSGENITPDTQLVLANVIFFKGVWNTTFSPDRTVPLTFSPAPTIEQKSLFMHQSGKFRSGEDATLGAKWLALPFEGGEYSMIFILPTEQHELDALLQKMTSADLDRIIRSDESRKVTMSIPKFRLASEIDLSKVLIKMGVRSIFTENSGLSGLGSSRLPLSVSAVLHKADMEVDERGSVAAAATALTVNTLSLSPYGDDFRFTANQPFLVALVDQTTLTPIFLGKITKPNVAG